MENLAISKIMFVLSLTCLPLISFANEPLKQQGKTTLYQRVLSTPTCELKKDISEVTGQQVPAFSRYYVYERKNQNNQEWLSVGPDSYGKTVGWINGSCAIEWNMQMTLVFTNPVERDPLLFFKDKDSLTAIVDSEHPETLLKPIREALNVNQTSPKVIAQEPAEFVDFKNNFYLLPILQGEEVMNGQGFYERILEVASVSKQDKLVATTQNVKSSTTTQKIDDSTNQVAPFKAAIVFVIDSTISMDPYISRTKEAVERVYQHIEKEKLQDQVKFGLVSFRSSLTASDKLEFVTKVFADPNQVKNREDFKKLSASLKQASVSTAYFAEDSFAGVAQALNDINWNSFGARYMILITDASAIPGDDKLSSTGMDAAQLRLEAQHKGVAIYALHLKTASGEKDHQIAATQYSDLTYNDFIHKSLYYPVNAGNVNEFGQKVDSLAKALAEQVKLAYKGEASIGNAINAKDGNADMLNDALLLGKAMQLAYLGETNGSKAPSVFKAWIADKDFIKPTIPTAEPRILLTKSQLSDLSDIVSKIANAANDGLISADDMFSQLRSVAAAMGQDPSKLKSNAVTKIADLGLLGEYLDNIPYKSDVTGLDQETWKSMSGLEQEKFIRNLNSKIRYYQKCNADVDRWISLAEGSDPRENVYPIPLEMLP
ncbi:MULTISPECIES: vWA domain-containing protein [unclassified Gilliamella]|uniref:vWA domain-containing protein n=1 Tax=unclassified Gilliamella TaxID=2685620 RepID=UPI00226A11D3|nr:MULTISPECIES: vWA domain-containing protein [unclassified Gilliamella]MCX8574190.1 VWA domain-containing protein [Gilliamella sp. B3831]MCX8576421.1 VWA domain-containing protein [Gilliamella sp. B3815]MCX8590922.1 VWA domain-containing protein [Gilliamella sp. B3812]MCX8603692.1 VWA domain-containing protein [Gilliamella sp. B3823]MCX8606084.1 VWA domain-containing protein [Gilliamella sp. B3825]